jgi:L-fuconolactonase
MNSIHIDAHQHFWICSHDECDWIDDSMAALRLNLLPEELALELNQNGFARPIAVQARQTLEETRWLIEQADRTSTVFAVVGWVDLRAPDARAQLAGQHKPGTRPAFGVMGAIQDRFVVSRWESA